MNIIDLTADDKDRFDLSKNIPNDIHYHLIRNMKNCYDIVNLKDTCSTFRNLFNEEINIARVDLFKINITFKFNNYDLKKHEMICRKFSKFKEEFYNGFIHFDRKTCNSIFNTITIIYISLYIDNLKEFRLQFMNYLEKYDIKKIIENILNKIILILI